MAKEPTSRKWARMQAKADDILPSAFTSLTNAACYAVLTMHPDALAAVDCSAEQYKIFQSIVKEGLTPFSEGDDIDRIYEWLDGHIDSMGKAHPLIARYAELHEMRWKWLPARN